MNAIGTGLMDFLAIIVSVVMALLHFVIIDPEMINSLNYT